MNFKEPEFVQEWRQTFDRPAPRCCYTCNNYRETGECSAYQKAPTEEFAQSIGRCKLWVEEREL